MRSEDWRMLRTFGYILGFLLLIGGIFAYTYTEARFIFVVAPYRDMAAPLILVGVVLLVLGYVCNTRARDERELEIPSPSLPPTPPKIAEAPQRFCKYCGHALTHDAEYCPNCGKARD